MPASARTVSFQRPREDAVGHAVLRQAGKHRLVHVRFRERRDEVDAWIVWINNAVTVQRVVLRKEPQVVLHRLLAHPNELVVGLPVLGDALRAVDNDARVPWRTRKLRRDHTGIIDEVDD